MSNVSRLCSADKRATDEERVAVMASAGAVFAGALRYEERLAGRRRVRVFVLEPVSD